MLKVNSLTSHVDRYEYIVRNRLTHKMNCGRIPQKKKRLALLTYMSPISIPQETDVTLRMMFVGLIYKTRTVLYEQTVIALEASSFFFVSHVRVIWV